MFGGSSSDNCVTFFDKNLVPLECDRIARKILQTQCFEPNDSAMNWLEGETGDKNTSSYF